MLACGAWMAVSATVCPPEPAANSETATATTQTEKIFTKRLIPAVPDIQDCGGDAPRGGNVSLPLDRRYARGPRTAAPRVLCRMADESSQATNAMAR